MISEVFEAIFIQAHIPGKVVENAMSVPRKALYNDDYVYCIKNGRLDYRQVQIARRETDSVIVTGGLAIGDTLVVEVMQGVASGMIARPKSTAPEERIN